MKMAKLPQDVFAADDDIVKPLTPRIDVALTIPNGVDLQITINGVRVLLDDEEDDAG
jgi:hypothetical protein